MLVQEIKTTSTFQFNADPRSNTASTALDELQEILGTSPEASQAIHTLKTLSDNPFAFDNSILFTYSNAIFALGNAINRLLDVQPGLLASEEQISNELVGPLLHKWSAYWLGRLKDDVATIGGDSKDDPVKLAKDQGQLNLDSAASSASSTALNGVQSLITQGVSSKTTTYQNLSQQAMNVVVALLNFTSQNWVI